MWYSFMKKSLLLFVWFILGQKASIADPHGVIATDHPSEISGGRIHGGNRPEEHDPEQWSSSFPSHPERYRPMPLPEPRDPVGDVAPEQLIISYDIQTGIESVRNVEIDIGLESYMMPGYPGAAPGSGSDTSEECDSRNFTDLELVEDPDLYPWRVNAKLFMQFGSNYYVASGTLIDPYHVLTAGHCVYDFGGSGWADNIIVVPAYENGARPYGDATAVQLHSWTGWTNSGSFDHDLGVIDLDRPVGAITGWHGYGYNNSGSFFTGNTFHNPGYPAESPYNGQYMYYWYGNFDIAYTYQVQFFKQAYGGQSGSGAYHIDGDNRTVYAALSNGWSLWTNDVRITEIKFGHISTWIADDTPSTFDLVALDVNTAPATVEAGTDLSSMDYLVHNYSSASWDGSVSVTVFLSTNSDISPADTPIQAHSFSYSFGPKSSVRVTVSTPPTIPANTTAGGYYLGVILDITDFDTNNNDTDGQDASYLTVTPETVPPDAITDLDAECGGSDVILSWSVPYDNAGVVGYYVYEHMSVGDLGSQLTYVAGGGTVTYTILGVCGDPSVNHYYDVRACDAAGNTASPSNLAGEFDYSLQ
jgi:V8-like Glu-specific endopeptidase